MTEEDRLKSQSLMLKAVSVLGKARSLKDSFKLLAVSELKRGAKKMNRAIELDPYSLDNRLIRLRHLLGATIKSPLGFISEVEEDIEYISSNIDTLEKGDRINFYSARGEYELFKNNPQEARDFLNKAINIDPNHSMAKYSLIILEGIPK